MPASSGSALIALQRFGLGARPGDLSLVGADARGYVLAQIAPDAVKPLAAPDGTRLPSSAEALLAQRRFQNEFDLEKARPLPTADPAAAAARQQTLTKLGASNPTRAIAQAEITARFDRLVTTQAGFAERLVLFWSNHFSVAAGKTPGGILAGPFEREAIRPFVFARFGDMLKAVEQHPAMLAYLDNLQSIGPDSRQGQGGKRGLNENLAREILELHTLGVDGGYAQADVTAFARVITGWVTTNPDDDELHGGRFTFAMSRHEPGEQVIMGKTYPDDGLRQGEAVLADLAVHPSTARHIATKLVHHFIADDPPPALIAKLETAFRESGGDLAAVSRALVSSPEAWVAPPTKLRTPQEFLVACFRALGRVADPNFISNGLNLLGQPLWGPIGPNGFSDLSREWEAPAGLAVRLDIAAQLGRQNAALDPKALLDSVLGPTCSDHTRQAVARAESRSQGLALLLMSPEFQRR